jgi:hypothetical protein
MKVLLEICDFSFDFDVLSLPPGLLPIRRAMPGPFRILGGPHQRVLRNILAFCKRMSVGLYGGVFFVNGEASEERKGGIIFVPWGSHPAIK